MTKQLFLNLLVKNAFYSITVFDQSSHFCVVCRRKAVKTNCRIIFQTVMQSFYV